MATVWRDLLLEQLDFYWNEHLWPRLAGLTDAEYLWAPAPGAWTVHEEAGGDIVLDSAVPEPPVPPLTTIAWRMAHVGRDVFGKRARAIFGGSAVPGADMFDDRHWPEPLPLTAEGGVELLERGYRLWREGILDTDDDGLLSPLGPVGGPFSEDSLATLCLHLSRELMAHGAEICLLRDLYRAQEFAAEPLFEAAYTGQVGEFGELARNNPETVGTLAREHPTLLADVAALEHWDVVRELAGLGFPLTSATDSGATALHYAAAHGAGEVVRFLVQRGADPHARESQYGFDPAGWAEFFGHPEIAAFLRDAGPGPDIAQ